MEEPLPTAPDPGSRTRMVLAAIIANLPGLSAGLSMGFSAILIPQLQEPDSDIPITLEQGSWIASLFVIGDLLGCTVGGPIADRFGRRMALLVDCLPLIIGWILTWRAQSLLHLYIARAITGIGIGAGVPITSMYLREISTPELRGTLTILMPAAANSGYLLMYIFGYYLAWRDTCILGLLLPFLPFVLVYFLPETPIWLLKRGRYEDASRTMCVLRGQSKEDVNSEVDLLQKTLDEESTEGGGLRIKSLLERTVLIPMSLLVFLFFTQSFSGSNMVSYYTVTIFQIARIPLDENLAAILVAAQYVVGYSITSFLVTRFPRRVLLFTSLLIMGLANTAAGLALIRGAPPAIHPANQTHVPILEPDQLIPLDLLVLDQSQSGSQSFNQSASNLDFLQPNVSQSDEHFGSKSQSEKSIYEQALSFVPVISCVLITFGYGCGLGPVPFILFGELFPSSVRGTATSITAFLRSITVFFSIKIFPSLLGICGIGGSFFTCAFVCFVALGISYFTVPETKGLNTENLENIYKKNKNNPAALVGQTSVMSTTSETKNLV